MPLSTGADAAFHYELGQPKKGAVLQLKFESCASRSGFENGRGIIKRKGEHRLFFTSEGQAQDPLSQKMSLAHGQDNLNAPQIFFYRALAIIRAKFQSTTLKTGLPNPGLLYSVQYLETSIEKQKTQLSPDIYLYICVCNEPGEGGEGVDRFPMPKGMFTPKISAFRQLRCDRVSYRLSDRDISGHHGIHSTWCLTNGKAFDRAVEQVCICPSMKQSSGSRPESSAPIRYSEGS